MFGQHRGELIIQLANGNQGLGLNAGDKIVLDLGSGSVHDFRSGRRLNLGLAADDVAIPEEIPTYLGGYRNAQYRFDDVSIPILVDKDEDQYRTFSSNNAFQRVHVKISGEGDVPEIKPESSLATYKTQLYAIGGFISDRTQAAATGRLYNPRKIVKQLCADKLALDRECEGWTFLTTTGNWNANNVITLLAAQKWNGGASSNPILDLQTAVLRSTHQVNAIWMNQDVAFTMTRHPEVREHMRQLLGDAPASTLAAQLGSMTNTSAMTDFYIPGLPVVKVAGAKVLNESTGNLDFTLGNDAVLVHSPPGPPKDGQDLATTTTFRERLAFGTGFQSKEVRVEERGGVGGVLMICARADDIVMTGNNVGAIVKNCVQ